MNFASTFSAMGMSVRFRGPVAVVELVIFGAIALLSVVASWSLVNRAPHGIPLARIALVASTLRELLALYWTRLPSSVVPGTRGLYAAILGAHAAVWLLYLARSGESGRRD
jgi:hypothetical protein